MPALDSWQIDAADLAEKPPLSARPAYVLQPDGTHPLAR